ncbi:MAG TPA: DNA polymerase Y family protein [Phycisphaerales bacterium]|nr:DNA polymerase Y family protein [Phycisphaerales bacterium]
MVLSLFLPWWPAERAIRKLGSPAPKGVLLVCVKDCQQIVTGIDAAAHRAGVRPGLSVAHARAMLADAHIHVQEHDEHADAHGLLALARWASKRWSPTVSVDPPDGLLMDITGCAHLFNGEHGLLASVEAGVARLGLTPRAGIASTVGTAWAVARFADREDALVPRGSERAALAHLPTAALRLEPETTEALAEVGIERVGQVFDLPRNALPARYGTDLIRRLDQALGLVPEIVDRTCESLAIQASRELPGGTTHLETIELVITMLLVEIAASLASHESGLRRLDAVFDRLDAESQHITIQVSRPTRDDRHLWSLLRPKVERLNMGFGVERVTLRVGGITRLVHRQGSFAGERAREHNGELAAMLDTLASRLGRTNVLRTELVQSHRPERAFRLVPIDDASGTAPPLFFSPVGPRPSRLLDPPCPAQILTLTPDGPVSRVRWRGHDHTIHTSIGPERLAPEWWKGREPTRDYFRVQTEDGRWLWLFREACSTRWFVHGEWC